MGAHSLPVLMYHYVSRFPGATTVSPEHFEAQCRGMAEHGWRGVGLDDEALRERARRHGLTYTVHLPLDLRLADGGAAEHESLLKARRVIDEAGGSA